MGYLKELSEKIAKEIYDRYEVSRKLRDGDTLGKLSMSEIIEQLLTKEFPDCDL